MLISQKLSQVNQYCRNRKIKLLNTAKYMSYLGNKTEWLHSWRIKCKYVKITLSDVGHYVSLYKIKDKIKFDLWNTHVLLNPPWEKNATGN